MKRGEDREKLKERLANTMAYGDSEEQTPPPPPRLPIPPPKLPTDKEKWNDLLTQIRERAEWLAEMEDLGQAGPHREIIKEQIAERLRALDALGIDSECLSIRSDKSGFSTVRSKEPTARSGRVTSGAGSVRSDKSAASKEKQKSTRSSGRGRNKHEINLNKEENVSAYGPFTPLQYSPRRRV